MNIEWISSEAGKVCIKDISDAVSVVTWSGSTSQAARTAEITVINAPNDKNITGLKLLIATGDVIKIYEKSNVLFVGEVITKETVSETGTITYSCTDFLNHFLKSTGIYNFSNTTAEKITEKLCIDFGVEIGRVEKTNIPIKKMIVDGSTIYDIIMMAYSKAAKQTGDKYICRMNGKKLTVEKKGVIVNNFILAEKYNITNTRQEESIDNMINLVKIYDGAGKQIGEVKRDEWIEKYGIYQQVYKKEKGVNEITAAENMMQGVEKKVSLNGIMGNLQCIAGNGVEVYDQTTGLSGLFWIDNDSHTWENGIHMMSLELNFQNVMDYKESDEQ
jgi:hypothetical protein